jgi:hypothetical protein
MPYDASYFKSAEPDASHLGRANPPAVLSPQRTGSPMPNAHYLRLMTVVIFSSRLSWRIFSPTLSLPTAATVSTDRRTTR